MQIIYLFDSNDFSDASTVRFMTSLFTALHFFLFKQYEMLIFI